MLEDAGCKFKLNFDGGGVKNSENSKKYLKKFLYCIERCVCVYLGFTKIQFYQHMFRKKNLITPCTHIKIEIFVCALVLLKHKLTNRFLKIHPKYVVIKYQIINKKF